MALKGQKATSLGKTVSVRYHAFLPIQRFSAEGGVPGIKSTYHVSWTYMHDLKQLQLLLVATVSLSAQASTLHAWSFDTQQSTKEKKEPSEQSYFLDEEHERNVS